MTISKADPLSGEASQDFLGEPRSFLPEIGESASRPVRFVASSPRSVTIFLERKDLQNVEVQGPRQDGKFCS